MLLLIIWFEKKQLKRLLIYFNCKIMIIHQSLLLYQKLSSKFCGSLLLHPAKDSTCSAARKYLAKVARLKWNQAKNPSQNVNKDACNFMRVYLDKPFLPFPVLASSGSRLLDRHLTRRDRCWLPPDQRLKTNIRLAIIC